MLLPFEMMALHARGAITGSSFCKCALLLKCLSASPSGSSRDLSIPGQCGEAEEGNEEFGEQQKA